jgi:sugar phosphate permease
MGTYKHISIWFPPGAFATISGLTLSIGTLGNAVATAPLAVAVTLVGWRKAFLLIVCIHLLITILIYAVVRDYPEGEEQRKASPGQRGNPFKGSMDGIMMVFRLPSFWLIALASFVRYGTYISIAGLWAGPYLEHVYHVSLVDRGKILLAIPLGYMIASPIFGILSDRVFRNRKAVVLGALFFYTLFIFPLTGFCPFLPLSLIVATFFFIGVLSSFSMIMYANVKELLPSSISGTAMSAVNFFTFAGGGFFQHVMGALIQRFSLVQGQLPAEAFSFAFDFCFFAAALGTLAYLFVKEARL